MAAVFYWSQKKPQTGSRAVKGRPYSRSWIVFEGRREGQFPIPSVSLRSTSPLDKGSRPLPYQRNARFPVCVGEPLGAPASSVTLRVPPSPKWEGKAFPFRGRCPRRGRMRYPVFRTRHVGSATPGAEVEPHQLQFSKNPGPSGPEEIAESHSDFARRKCFAHPKG